MRRILKILPFDAECKEIDVPINLHNGLSRIANKRTGYIRERCAYGTCTITAIIESAYIQGMADMADAVINNTPNQQEQV